MRIVFIVFALLIATILAQVCSDGKAPEKRSNLGVCHGYEAVEACCTEEQIKDAKENALKKKVCGVATTEADFSKDAPYMCLGLCNVHFQNGTLEYLENGKLRICKSYGDYMYNQIKDSLICTDSSKPCFTDPDSAEGCEKFSEVYKSAKDYIDSLGIYVEDNTKCWNSGAKVAISLTAAIVAFIALF